MKLKQCKRCHKVFKTVFKYPSCCPECRIGRNNWEEKSEIKIKKYKLGKTRKLNKNTTTKYFIDFTI